MVEAGHNATGQPGIIAVVLLLLTALYQLGNTIYHQIKIHKRREVLSRLLSGG